jgi:AcrR family transcriptional regulator
MKRTPRGGAPWATPLSDARPQAESSPTTRPYRQRRRAEATEARTEAILEAAMAAFVAKPFDQITLAEVAEQASVGVQTLIRRVQTKDGLVRAVNEWAVAAIGEARGEPDSPDPDAVAAAIARQYERFGSLIDRTIRQEEVSPALAESAQGGRAAHRAWIETAFADEIARRGPELIGQLIALCGVELWLVLRRDGGLTPDQARDTVAHLIRSVLP